MHRRTFLAAVLAVPAVAFTGCSQGRGSLTGKVTYRRQILTSGTVSYQGADLKIDYAPIQPDGSYSLPDVPGGTVKLAVESPNPETAMGEANNLEPGAGANLPLPQRGEKRVKAKDWFEVPAQFARFEDSGLTVEVSGATVHDIEMTA